MKDRLIELIKSKTCQFYECPDNYCEECEHIALFNSDIEKMANFIIADGWTRPPCKVGDTIYRCGDPIKAIYEWEIEHIEIYADEIVYIDDSDNEFTDEDIGKTVFLTREEAEQALKGGAE